MGSEWGELAGCVFARSASIRSVSSTADVAYRHPAVPEQGCTSCERGRVVMGRLKRMIVTVSSSSRLPVSARVPETDCHVSDLIIPFSGFLFGQLLINGSVFAKTSIKVRFQLTRGSGPENV